MIGSDFQWPVKILLVHPQASFFQKPKLTIAADCAVLSNESFVNKFRNGETVIIGCPLLEDPNRIMGKLALVMKEAVVKEVEVYTMEVPCCHAIHMMVMKAIKEAGKENADAKYYIVRVMSKLIEPYKPGVIDESMMEAEIRTHKGIHHHEPIH